MPCPFFEPRQKANEPSDATARLPLLFEFDGVCQVPGLGERSIDPAHRFRYCNRGNARGACSTFPQDARISAVRFTVAERTSSALTVLVMEEEDHWPRGWSRVEFQIGDNTLVPEIEDVCRRAQVFQFCRSYLEKF